MSSMERIEAERTVDRLERDAETQWRIDVRQFGLTNVTNDTLRDALIDALASVDPMRKLVKSVKEGAEETLDGMRDSDRVAALIREAQDAGVDGEEVTNARDVVASAKPADLAGNMLELLEAAIRFYSSRVARPRDEELPAILHVPLPPRTKRQRTGSTTAWLPFLFDHVAGANVAVNDPLPSPLAPVKSAAGEKKKRTKAEKKAA